VKRRRQVRVCAVLVPNRYLTVRRAVCQTLYYAATAWRRPFENPVRMNVAVSGRGNGPKRQAEPNRKNNIIGTNMRVRGHQAPRSLNALVTEPATERHHGEQQYGPRRQECASQKAPRNRTRSVVPLNAESRRQPPDKTNRNVRRGKR